MRVLSLLAAGAAALALVSFSPAADAKTKVYLNIGPGYPGYSDDCQWVNGFYRCFGPRYPRHREHFYGAYDDDYDDDYEEPVYRHRLGCAEARYLVRERGFRKVRVQDCSGKTYKFSARKNGHRYIVRVNSITGRFKAHQL